MTESRRRVLIITYYWPPSGGAGVQRWLKFVKYLREFGWEPVVYTPENPEAPAEDTSLLADIPPDLEIIRTKIWEPYQYYKKLTGLKAGEKVNAGFLSEKKKPGLAEKVSVWIRGNFFIPDARMFWIKPSVKFLSDYLGTNPVEALISTGPPHSMHMIALGLKQKFNLPWLADFRDPWTGIDFFHQLHLSGFADRKHHRLEKKVLQQADAVSVISNSMAEEFKSIHNRDYFNIPNGFDEQDVHPLPLNQLTTTFSISHIGSIAPARNPRVLWKVLSDKVQSDPAFAASLEIRLTGKADHTVLEAIEQSGLSRYLTLTEYLPHDKVLSEMQKSQLLLLLINNTPNAKGIVTGKLFEYMAAGRPILSIGPTDGDAAYLISSTNSGITVDFEDQVRMKEAIENLFIRFREQRLVSECTGIQHFTRRNLTGDLSKALESIAGKTGITVNP